MPKGNSRSLALDLYDQVTQLDKTNQFRFTPPTHSMLAFKRALEEYEEEGRGKGRSKRFVPFFIFNYYFASHAPRISVLSLEE